MTFLAIGILCATQSLQSGHELSVAPQTTAGGIFDHNMDTKTLAGIEYTYAKINETTSNNAFVRSKYFGGLRRIRGGWYR
jgi:hypothetical protein